MVSLTIDNRQIEVPEGTKVIEAAEQLGIMIPRFCFHPALGAAGACRVCAVAFKEGPLKGIQMSCMVEAQDGMVVSTTDAEAVDFRRHVIEWLMLHHPHDCPVCDEGGHCLLQDLTVSGGHGRRRYEGLKRTHRNQDLGPLIQHEMNRCIQCYRCSRYYQEYSGYRDLGVRGIGSRVYFGRIASGILESPFAGNLIDICPTGVYTDKPSRYFGRRWDFQRSPSVCLHCSMGCSLTALARYRRVVRHEARFNEAVNGYFICDRGRYAYAYASATDRPRQAMATGTHADSNAIIVSARKQIRNASVRLGPGSVAVTASSRCSLEAIAMAADACRRNSWAGPAVASSRRLALNGQVAVNRLTPELAVSLNDLSSAAEVVVIGADPVSEAPMLALALRQAQRRGGRVTVIDPRGVQMPLEFDHWPVHPQGIRPVIQALIHALAPRETDPPESGLRFQIIDMFPVKELARRLAFTAKAVIVCGTDILTPQDVFLAGDLAEILDRREVDARLFHTLSGANAFAAGLTGASALSLAEIMEGIEAGRIRVLITVEQDLWNEYGDRRRLMAALEKLDHLVVLGHLNSPLNERADSFIPTQTLYETGGRWINSEGRLQITRAVMAGGESIEVTGGLDHPPRVFGLEIPGSAPRAAWEILAALSLNQDGLGTPDPDRLLADTMAAFHPALDSLGTDAAGRRIDLAAMGGERRTPPRLMPDEGKNSPEDTVTLLLVDAIFGTEPLSATAPPLAEVTAAPEARMHPEEISRLGLKAGKTVMVSTANGSLSLPLAADDRMATGVLVIPRHYLLDWQVLGGTRLALDPNQISSGS